MEEIKNELDKIKKILIEDFNPLVIILYGSYARNSQNSESDIDIAIITEKTDSKTMFYEKQKIEIEISKDIDLVNIANDNISDILKYEVLMNGIVLYCKDSYKYNMIKLDILRECLDYNERIQDIMERVKKGGDIYGK